VWPQLLKLRTTSCMSRSSAVRSSDVLGTAWADPMEIARSKWALHLAASEVNLGHG